MNKTTKFALSTTPILAITAATLLFYPSLSPAAPPIKNWEPAHLAKDITDDSIIETVSFVATKNLKNVAVHVVPELESYIDVSPASFASLNKGESYQFNLTLSASADAVVGVYEGAIQLRSESGRNRVYAKPLPVQLTVVPFPLPPDPGEEGKETIAGIDSDNDGLRDDVQRWIGMNAYTSESGHAALMQNARALQDILVANTDEEIIAAAHRLNDAGQCLFFVRGDNDDAPALRAHLRAEMLNTLDRSNTYLLKQKVLNGQIFDSVIAEWQYKCLFDPWAMDT